MIVERPDPAQVVLQAYAQNLDGSPKTSLASASVRVYRVNAAGAEVEELASTALIQVGSTNAWRYLWEPASLAVSQYHAEFLLVDNDGLSFVDTEDMVVQDFALQVDVALIREVETGRWKIDQVTDQMTFYDNTDTPILTFDLKDIDGLPNHINIFERKPV